MVSVFPVHGVVPEKAFCLLPRAGIEFLYQTGNRLGWPIEAVWSKAAVTSLHWADKFDGKKKLSFPFLYQFFTFTLTEIVINTSQFHFRLFLL